MVSSVRCRSCSSRFALLTPFGLIGIGTDYEAIARITNQRLDHCEKVRFPCPLPSASAVHTLLLTAESGSRLRSHLVLGRCVFVLAAVGWAECREAIPASSSTFYLVFTLLTSVAKLLTSVTELFGMERIEPDAKWKRYALFSFSFSIYRFRPLLRPPQAHFPRILMHMDPMRRKKMAAVTLLALAVASGPCMNWRGERRNRRRERVSTTVRGR